MSDGGKVESRRKIENVPLNDHAATYRASWNEFGRAISKIAVGQICESVGFESFNESALESMADIAVRYLRDLGKTSSSYANLAGRTECNVFDIIQSLEDLGPSIGFTGAAEAMDCITGSGAIKQIIDYVDSAKEIPFVQPVPHFPVVKDRKLIPSFLQMGEAPDYKYIPAWLPAFPDPHTYIHSPVWNERTSDLRADKIELVRQRRKAERSLLSLQQRLLSNCDTGASTSMEPHHDLVKVEVNGSANPFFARPLQAGEQDVSYVVLPAKLSNEAHRDGHLSLSETFAPAIEAMKDGLSESGNNEVKILPDKRLAICLEFKTGKKVSGDSLGLRLQNRVSDRTGSWFGRDDEKDDKKRRAEFILRQSVENQQELTQL